MRKSLTPKLKTFQELHEADVKKFEDIPLLELPEYPHEYHYRDETSDLVEINHTDSRFFARIERPKRPKTI